MNNSQNIKGNNNNNNFSNNHNFYNNQFQFSNPNQEPDFEAYDKSPVTIFNKQIKTFWFLIAAFVGFSANVVTIYSSFKDFPNIKPASGIFYIIPTLIFGISLSLYSLLSKTRLFKFRELSVANYNGNLFFEKYKGTCPCGGKLRFFQDFRTLKGYAQCMANDEHIFAFSPKRFDKKNYATA